MSARLRARAPGLPGQLALLALVLAASASLLQPAAGQLEASDGTALQDLAAGLGASLPSWTGTLPCSEGWERVTCCFSPAHMATRVCEVDLSSLGLSGTIPAGFSTDALIKLDISNNNLTGTLPALVLPSLSHLLLSSSQLSGNSTDGLQALCSISFSLQVLDLRNNPGLQGEFPDCFSSLMALQQLRLSYTGLTGTLPNSWGFLGSLVRLDLASTGWVPHSGGSSSWPAWDGMGNLQWLDLSDPTSAFPNITEKLPADWFSGMTSLQTFMCTNCNWAEAADPAMAAWQALSWLDISGNPLQLGAVRADSSPANMLPPEWAQLNLMALKVRDCNLAEWNSTLLAPWELQPAQGLLRTLRILDISNNPGLYFIGMDVFFGQMQLWELYIGNTLIEGAGWANMPCLLDYAGNTALLGAPPTDTSSSGICRTNPWDEWSALLAWKQTWNQAPWLTGWDTANTGCPNGWTGVQCDPDTGRVTGLDLSNIQLCYPLSPCPLPTTLLDQLSALDTLRLRGAGITGQLADLDLSPLPRLRVLDLSGNPGLMGPLPDAWPAEAPSLVSLELSGMQGMDTLPGTWVNNDTWSNLTTLRLVGGGLLSMPLIWGMQALTHLDLSRNNLTGPLPAFNGSGGIAPLEQLDLSHNALAGGLPPDWGTTLPSLSVLLLSANQLNGTLPTEWGSSMTTLTWLDLSSNRLAGPLPGSWNQMGSLVNLTLSHNNFTGPLPSAWLDATVPHLHLQAFACANCNLSGPMPPWGDPNSCGSEAMQHFNVSGNALTGSVPDSMAAWGGLLSFDVSRNRLNGTVFGSGATCDLLSLLTLKLAGNLLDGPIPANWETSLPALQVLDASNNLLSGGVPPFLATLPLQQLHLHGNNLSGPLPMALNATPALRCLTLHTNPGLCGPAPNGSTCFSKAGTQIGFNCSTGAPLSHQAHYCVNAPDTQCSYVPPMSGQGLLLKAFRDSIGMNDLGTWSRGDPCSWRWVGVECDASGTSVVALKLKHSHMSSWGSLNWDALANVTTLRVLELPRIYYDSIAWQYPLPHELSRLASLEVLNISGINMGGQLPDSWAELRNLTHLDISDWSIGQRALPLPWIYNMTSLQVLRAVNARIAGSLDSLRLGKPAAFPSLRVLLLNGNADVIGTLPLSWMQRPLQVLGLNGTGIFGTLPQSWGDNVAGNLLRSSLQQLLLHNTALQGSIPASWTAGLPNVTVFTAWGTQLCGPHPANGTGLGALCLDTTNTMLGTSCNDPGLVLAPYQQPPGCMSQPPSPHAGPSPMLLPNNTWDRDQLRLLKASLGHPPVLSSWDSPGYDMPCASPGRWKWLECDAGGSVARLQLSGLGLSGPLPAPLWQLRMLQELDLSRNAFAGTIPANESTATWWRLAKLDLSFNTLTGPLPANWSGLTSLQQLDMSGNNFTGNLPNEWGTCGWPNTCMSGLKNLTCAACGLSGPLPTGWQWMSLHTLVLPRNRISGGLPDSWAQLPGFSYVDLSFNQLTAVPHNSYFSTVNIQVAYLQGNALNSSLPTGWLNTRLERLDLSQNQLTGPLPGWAMGEGPSLLHWVNLAHNQLSGFIPDQWSFNTGALRELVLSHNPQLAGNISAWSLPSSLAALHIANTSISGSLGGDWLSRQGPWLDCLVGYTTPGLCGTLAEGLPCSIVYFTDGTALGRSCANASIALAAPEYCRPSPPSCLESLHEARVLTAWKALLVDPAGRLANWSGLDPCTGWAGVTCNANRTAVIRVNVSGFGLTGPLTPALAQLASMQVLDVSNNSLAGVLPESFLLLDQLEVLNVASNALTGTLPASYGLLPSLRAVNASGNALQGGLPPDWFRLPLQLLDLSFNQLTGQVPLLAWSNTGMGMLSATLQTLLLAGNALSGQLQQTPGFPALTCWSVASNPQLCGPVPVSAVCGNVTNTLLGRDCMTSTILASNSTCVPASAQCVTLQQRPPPPAPALPPVGVDAEALLALKAAVIGPDCSLDSRRCAIFDTWSPGLQPCSSPFCKPCTLEHACGTLLQYGGISCNWRYIECNANGRVSKIVLDYGVVHSSGPRLTFGPLPGGLLANMSQLEELHLKEHTLLGAVLPQELGTLPSLRVLHLSGPAAPSSSLPSEWGWLHQLQSLWLLNMSGLAGSLPASWGNMSSLASLRITGAPGVSGTIPAAWSSMAASLRELQLSTLSLSGALADPWPGGLPHVTHLHITDTPALLLPANVGGWASNTSMAALVLSNAPGLAGLSLDACGLDSSRTWPNLTRLALSGLGLGGTLPVSWQTGLPTGGLELLDVSRNDLSGSLPSWLAGLLATDASLDVSHNAFTGPLPGAWAGGPPLRSLLLQHNTLTGGIPDSWAWLVYSTWEVDVSNNRLVGAIPGSWFNASLFTGAQPPRISRFGAQHNPCLCGGVPGWLLLPAASINATSPNNATTNSTSSINGTALNSTASNNSSYVISSAIGSLALACGTLEADAACAVSLWPPEYLQDAWQLLTLKAAAADASTLQRLASWRGTVPPCTNSSSTGNCVLCDDSVPLQQCGGPRPSDGALTCNWRFIQCRDRRIVEIDMAYQGLAFAYLPPHLANGTMLESLDLQHTSVLGGALPSEYAAWTNLTTFRLRGPVWGQLPLAYTAWSRLRAFELTSTALTGTIPPSYFSSWPALENFTLDGASIGGYLPPPWGCPNLSSYIVQNTPVVSNASSPLWVFSPLASSLTRLVALGLGGTMLQLLSWTVLKDVLAANGWAVQLKALSCPGCGFSGPLGALAPYFPSLAVLDLSVNQLSGVIPPDLASYSGLKYISLARNRLYGTLPPGLVGVFGPGFVYGLDLSHNLLTGGLPDAWGTAAASTNTSFWTFQLQSNGLTGTIPDSWAHLIATSNTINLSNLQLAGPLPPSLEAVMNSTAGHAGNMSRSIRFANNTCLCGPVPALLKSITSPDAAIGTQLERACPTTCTPGGSALPVFSHPDWPALLLLRAAIVGGPAATLAVLNTTWSNTTSRTPCHDVDPNCLPCPLVAAASGGCAGPVAGPGGRPSYFCNAAALACMDGRVMSINVSHAGLVLSHLPANVSQLSELRHLGLEGIQLGSSMLPSPWSALSKLVSLQLSANGTRVGALPPSWGLLQSLQRLSLANLTVEAAGLPSGWSNLTSLQSLELHDINLMGDGLMLPAAWGSGLRSLANLTLSRVRGLAAGQQLPDSWVVGLPALKVLQLTEVGNLSSPLVHYAQLVNRPSSNATTGGLRILVLSGLNLTGTIPATLLNTSWSLQHLSLARNQLTGAIDTLSWANATALRKVNLSRNALSGQLPAAWAALRGANISIDVSFNNISGPLPAAWALAGTDGGALQLALLNATSNALTGSLPTSWSNLSAVTPTTLLLAGNQLTGGIPAEWGNRTSPNTGVVPGGLLWAQLDVANNSRMCGPVPAWFYGAIALGNATLARQLLQGTSLADACLPASFDHFFNTLGAVMPTMRTNVTLRLTSRVAPLSTSWLVAMQAPNGTAPQPLGPMQLLGNTSAGVVWSFPVPRSLLSMRGNFTFSVSSSTNASAAVTNSPLVVEVFPAASAADASHFTISMAPSAAVGGIATVLIQVNDVSGAPTFAPANITLTISGSVSGTSNVTTAVLTRAAQTGLYSHSHAVLARERLTFRVAIDNAIVGTDTAINITATLPSAVDAAGSLAATTLARDGDASRYGLAGPVPLLASSWHLLFVPVLRASGGGGFFADPGLAVRLQLSAATSSNGTAPGNTTTALMFSGIWSSSNGCYVVPFKLPANGSYTGMLNIWPNITATAFLANRSLTFEAALLRAVAARSSLSLITGARQQAGELVYVVARLLSALGRPATSIDNVRLTVNGNVSGAVSVPPLVRQADGTWALSFVPQQHQALNISLAVDGVLAGSTLLVLTGVSPGYVAYNASLLQATLLSQGLAVSSPVASPGLSLLVYTGEASLLSFPLLDRAGSRVRADLGLKAVLSLVPADMEAAITAKYNLTAQPPLLHRRRSLLQAANTTSTNATSNSTVLLPPGWAYLADYASEAPEPYSSLEPAPLPPSYPLTTTALAPDTGNAIQDQLSAEAGVASFAGSFDTATGSFNFSLTPQVALPYLALLSVRHPNMSSSFALLQFRVAAAVNPASIVAPPPASSSTNTSSGVSSSAAAVTAADVALFNALVNPRVSFVAAFPRLSVAGFGGEAKLLAAYSAILAANGLLDGPNWVQAALVNSSSGTTTINTTMWFPSTYASTSSPFEGLSGLDYFIFLLNKLPEVAFGSTTYAAFVATNATVSNFTVALPGKSPEPGASYGAPPAVTAGSTTTSAGTAAAAPPPAAITIVSIAAADLEVVVAAPAPAPASSTSTVAAPPVPPPVDLSKILDTTPPVISLVGEPFMSVMQADKFSDPGATAYDNIDGNMQPAARLQLCSRPAGADSLPASDNRTLSCGATLSALNTSLPTPDDQAFMITYSARDAAGNRAASMRRFVVVMARCAAPERWCPDLAACSVQGLCLRAFTSAPSPSPASTTAAATAVYVPPVDKTPPKLTLLGSGRAAVTSTGAAIMMDNVTWKAVWSDPGASAFDAVDGDLSGAIQSFGAGAVDTSRPTSPGREFSFVVEYAVEDKSRNAAPIARRLIRVVCPSPEAYCVDPDTSAPTCTVQGVCGAPVLLSFGAASSGGGASSASTATSTAASGAASSRTAAAAPAPPTPPAISLLVPGPVQITAGNVYDRCADNAPISAVCERGVAAEDAKDGNMERQVLVCGSRWRPAGNQRSVPVLLACNISSSLPGDYSITFSVTNSAGLSASVVRRLTIKAACPEGEALCPDQITCSQGGTCVSTPAAPAASSSSSSSSAAAAAAASTTKAPAPNMAPAIGLITAPGFDAVVYVRRGSSYNPCKSGMLPVADSPCEPGANATDPDGLQQVGGSTSAADLTDRVVVCPPAACTSRGCSPVELRRHYFSAKGLQGCGIDTSRPEGTQFKVDFWVWDSGSPVLNASVARTVVLSPPCPSASAPHWCTDAAGRSFCSGSPCGTAQKLLPPAKPKPHIHLLHGGPVVYVEYGQPSAVYLGACASGRSNASCGAVAWDVQPGEAGRIDLSPFLSVTQSTPGCDPSTGQSCATCNLETLASSGNCLPGSYLLTFSVANDDGLVATAQRRLVVYQSALLTSSFVLYEGLTNSSQVDAIVANAANSSSAEGADVVALILSRLGTASAGLDAGDVQVLSASATQVDATNYSVAVNASIHVFSPAGVHRKDIQVVAAGAGAAAGGRRRLLVDAVATATGSASRAGMVLHAGQPPLAAVHAFLQLLDGHASCAGAGGMCTAADSNAAASAGRRLLQASADALQSSLQAVAGGLSSGLGAANVSSAVTTPPVDLQAAYLSALTSSLQVIGQQLSALNATSTAMSGTLSAAFGDEAEQRESQVEVQLTNMYRDLVAAYDGMVSALSVLADSAAAKFDQQVAATASLASALGSAITAMRESAALTQQLQQKYVEQTLMLQDATGTGVTEACNRTRAWAAAFTINSSVPAALAPATRRRLLVDGGSAAAAAGSTNDELAAWQGYQVSLAAARANWAVDETHAPEQARYIGAAAGHNKVVGGLFLHTTRKASMASCNGTSLAVQLNPACQRRIVPLARNLTSVAAYLASLFGGDAADAFPYGVDPAFLRSSATLYRPELQGRVGWFYNTSDPLQVPAATGTPFGFFHQPVKGYAAGFPVLLPNRLSQGRAAAALQYLLDGNYLDRHSRQLTAELLTYNADLRVLGYTRMTFTWQQDGAITGFVDVRGVPAVASAAEGGSALLVAWLLPVWLLCAVFWATTAWEARELLSRYQGDRHWLQVLASSFDWELSAAIALAMSAAVLLLTVFATATAPQLRPQAAYTMYDALTMSHARMFMPAKAYDEAAVAAGLAAAAGGPSSVLSGGQLPLAPGSAGRWLLPDTGADWEAWASLMAVVHSMAGQWAAYTLLQGVILVLLTLKLLRVWSFQAKLGLICNTLLQAAPQLAHLLFVIIGCVALFAGLSYLGTGDRVAFTRGYGPAFEEVLRSLLGLAGMKLPDVLPRNLEQPGPALLLSYIIYYGRELLFVMVLMQFFMTTLGGVFMELKRRALDGPGGGTSIPADLAVHVLPELRAAAARTLRRCQRRGAGGADAAAAAGGADAPAAAAAAAAAAGNVSHNTQALQRFLQSALPRAASGADAAAGAFGDKVAAVRVGGRWLDLAGLQQLLVGLALDGDSSVKLVQTGPARRYASRAAAVQGSSSSAVAPLAAADGGDTAVAAAALLLPEVGCTAVAAGGVAPAVAAALAVAEQLMASCGKAVDKCEVAGQCLDPGCLEQQLGEDMGMPELRPGHDFTLQDLHNVLVREQALHRQIYSAIWAAVGAMERWSGGVGRYLAKVTRETNASLADNARVMTALAGPGSSAAARAAAFTPVPVPKVTDLSQSLRPPAPAPALHSQQQQFGATVVVHAGGFMQPRAQPALSGAGGSAVSGEGKHVGFASNAAEAAAASSSSSGRRLLPHASAVAVELPHSASLSAGASSIRSPGGVSLHSRTPGAVAATPGSRASAPQQPWAAATAAVQGEATPASEAARSSGSPSRPRSGSVHNNRVVPVTEAAEVAAAVVTESGRGDDDGGELQGSSGGARLPTISGKAPSGRLQPLH